MSRINIGGGFSVDLSPKPTEWRAGCESKVTPTSSGFTSGLVATVTRIGADGFIETRYYGTKLHSTKAAALNEARAALDTPTPEQKS